ncbi:glycosyltransferase family 4 protein [Aromatoleum sp.]|uniref:glycosyltransferase family 4 protein n=1 Tax=Aromatoleum sp. TaxID=2307007 RepID=UPI002FCB72A0
MRIAHVVRQYHPSVGGMEDVVRNIARHQLESGHSPTVVTLDRVFRDDDRALPPDEEVDGVPVRRLSFRGPSRYPLCPQVLGALDGTDLIHVHGVDFFFDYLAATRWFHRRPMIASTHGGFFHTRYAEQLKRVFFHTVTRSSVRAYDRIIATSDNDGRMFGAIVGHGRLEVIENGVNVRKFRGRAATRAAPVMIYFGRWSENKGIPQAIELLGRLRAREPDWRLIVAGREFDLDLAELRAIVAAHGLDGAVELVANPGDAELAELIGRASYFVCLSRHEGFGLAAIEALSAGLIPVVSDIPPFRSLVVRSGLGVLAGAGAEDTVSAWFFASRQGDAATWSANRERAIRFADSYDWQRVAGRYLQVYDELENRQ